jgi:hypothetical protein
VIEQNRRDVLALNLRVDPPRAGVECVHIAENVAGDIERMDAEILDDEALAFAR